MFFGQDTVNHNEGEFVRGDVTTNRVESVFALLKRSLIGVYDHASKKHLGCYADEFAFRLNDGSVKRHTLDGLDRFVIGAAGKRLIYQALNSMKKPKPPEALDAGTSGIRIGRRSAF
jgi:hypothetical protein